MIESNQFIILVTSSLVFNLLGLAQKLTGVISAVAERMLKRLLW